MDKRYQIFISSTFADLEEERKSVMEAVLESNSFPAGMEMFPAIDIEQFEYIKKLIDKSDYYILVIAGRYGSLADDGMSYTEKEYMYAVEKKIPILCFIRRDIESIPARNTDQDRGLKEKLVAFRKKAASNRIVKFWDDKNELKNAISNSLNESFKTMPRTGWVRATSDNTKNDSLSVEQIYEKLKKSVELDCIIDNKEYTVAIKLMDFIMLLGDFGESIESDTYELNVDSIIKDSLKENTQKSDAESIVSGNISVNLWSVHQKLKVMNLISIDEFSNPVFYSIGLTTIGKNIYNKEVLKF